MPEYSMAWRARPESTSTACGLDDAARDTRFPTLYEHDAGPNGVLTVPIEIIVKWGHR